MNSLKVLMNVRPIGYSVYPNVMFTIEDGNSEKYFDIKTQGSTSKSGKVILCTYLSTQGF